MGHKKVYSSKSKSKAYTKAAKYHKRKKGKRPFNRERKHQYFDISGMFEYAMSVYSTLIK